MPRARTEARRGAQLLLRALRAPCELPTLPREDWELLLRVARRTRLLGRIESDLAQAGLLEHIPAQAANHLRAARNVVVHRQTLVAWEVNRVQWALQALDVPLVILKGAAYVLAGLPAARGRLFADLDLLVPLAQIEAVEQALVAHGWLRMQIDPYDDRYYRVWMHEIPPLRHRERKTEIDLHHTILPRTSRLKPDPALLLAAARPLEDPRLRVLAPADMVLHSLVHLFLEGDPVEGLRLRDLVDVRDLLDHFGQEPGFWASLVPRARELDLQRPLYYGLRFARSILGADIPAAATSGAEHGAPTAPVRWLMDWLVPLAMLPEHPDYPRRSAAVARWLLYARSHWLRMPPLMLVRHLGYKAWLRLRGVRKGVDLTQLDLKQ
ncbi:MAG: nucleotidyltransferase family protein [Gammaproteobacteria bacterium]|nr:nucleotidyltransferase family protein [Gammaproteobacteria bacterium]